VQADGQDEPAEVAPESGTLDELATVPDSGPPTIEIVLDFDAAPATSDVDSPVPDEADQPQTATATTPTATARAGGRAVGRRIRPRHAASDGASASASDGNDADGDGDGGHAVGGGQAGDAGRAGDELGPPVGRHRSPTPQRPWLALVVVGAAVTAIIVAVAEGRQRPATGHRADPATADPTIVDTAPGLLPEPTAGVPSPRSPPRPLPAAGPAPARAPRHRR
jgi:hypothetical protein